MAENNTIKIRQDSENPVDEVLDELRGRNLRSGVIDMTKLKPSRFKSGDVTRLLSSLYNRGSGFVIGVPKGMTREVESAVNEIVPEYDQHRYVIAEKNNLKAIMSQKRYY